MKYRSGALALLTTMAVLVPSAAVADSYVHSDPAGDVRRFATHTATTSTAAPDRDEGDVLSSSVAHGKKRVTMAMRAEELPSTGDGVSYLFRIGTKHKVRRLFIETGPGRWQGAKFFTKDNNKQTKCRGIRWSINYTTDVIVTSVPRRCLGKPKWVRVGMVLIAFEEPADFDDDAATTAPYGSVPRWGPRVYR